MELKLTLWVLAVLVTVLVWFYANLELKIDYQRHPQLIDSATGSKLKPSDLLDLTKIINKTKDYVDSTNAQQRLYDLGYYSNFENPFLIDHSYSRHEDLITSGYPVANTTLCAKHLDWLLTQLDAHKNYTFVQGQLGYELTTLMDSFGKPESGLYSGITTWPGLYKQCSKLSLNKGAIKTRYCFGRLRPKWWPQNETIYPATAIRMGVCIPESCDTMSFKFHKSSIETLAKLELPELYKNGLDMVSMFCLPDERSPIRAIPFGGYVFLTIVGIWCLIVVLATITYEFTRRGYTQETVEEKPKCTANVMDKIKSSVQCQLEQPKRIPSIGQRIFVALSLQNSLKTFKTNTFRIKYARGERVRVDLGGFYFWKVLMAIFIVLGHSGYLALTYSRSLANRLEMGTAGSGKMALSISRCVDIFFLYFGILTSYTLMRKFSLNRLANPLVWILVNLGIFLRITPIFMLVYWYSRLVSPYTGSGPWWDYGVDKYSMKGVCMSDAWWKSIPYFGSVGTPPVPSCLLPGWFIVSYSQLSLLLPLITYIICKLTSSIQRTIFTALLLVASATSLGGRLYAQTSVREEGFTLYGGFLSDLLEKFESTGHLTTLSRLGCVSVGCLVGYLLRQYELGVIQQWPKWLQKLGTVVLAIVLMALIIFLPLIGHYYHQATGSLISLEEFVATNVILVIVWPILAAIVIINTATVLNHTAIMRFFGHTFWRSFNKLGLAIFLVHWEVLFIGITNTEQAPTYGFVSDVMKMWATGVSISIILAFIIHLFIEAPLTSLMMILVKSFTKQDREEVNDLPTKISLN